MNNKYIIGMLTMATALTGCSDFLDTIPDNRTEIDTIEKVKSLLVSAYPDRTYASFLEPRIDGQIDHGTTMGGQMSSAFAFNQAGFRWDEYPSAQSSDDSENYWSASYRAIAASNHAIEAIEKIGVDKESRPYLAEAQLTRAFNHFNLLTLFADFFNEQERDSKPGIPYVTEPEEETNKQYDRETVAITLQRVKEDLNAGLQHVGGASAYTQPKFHFTLDAARMFALRVALYEGNYAEVINYANHFFPPVTDYTTLKGELEDGTIDTFYNKDGSEVRVPSKTDIAYQTAGTKLFDWNDASQNTASSTELGLTFTDVRNNNVILAAEPYSVMARVCVSNTIVRFTYSAEEFTNLSKNNATGIVWDLPTYSITSGATPQSPSFLPKTYEDFKTNGLNATSGVPFCRINIFRYEEALLARAEAYAMLGKYDEALADLTMYVQKRLLEPNGYYSRDLVVDYYRSAIEADEHFTNNTFNSGKFSSDVTSYEGILQRGLIAAVLDARRVEFLYEGNRWFDILRWKIPVTHRMNTGETSTLTPDDDRRVIQLPQTAELAGIQKNRYTYIPKPWM